MGTPLRLFLCLFLTGIHISLYSQAEESRPADRVSIKGTYTLKKIFDLIYRQTKQQITYANTLLDDRERVTVDVSGTIDEALTVILAGKAITWLISDGYISLRQKNSETYSTRKLSSPDSEVAIIDVSGTVSDIAGEKLPGATVQVRGMNKATMTDGEGRFRLMGILANAKLLVSYTGYEGEEIKLRGQRELNVMLRAGENRLSEAVVVAYGTTTQRSNTGAVTVVKGEQIQNLPNRSFDKSLQGLVPGLQITNGTGQPGGGISNMVQRGISTGAEVIGGSTVRNPLIVIDGIPVTQENFQNSIGLTSTPITNPLAQLNPSDIETMTVLRDAAAIALYGSKAGNGVILVTTKKGKAGKTSFRLRSQTDFAFLPSRNFRDIPSQDQYLQLVYDTYRSTNPITWSDEAIRKDLYSKFPLIINGTDTSFYSATDWKKELYRNIGVTYANEISMSGGNEKSNYYINFEYTKQNGIVKETGYDRKSLRINFENKALPWLTIGTKTMLSYNVQNATNSFESESSFGLISTMSPLNPVRNIKGDYIYYYRWGGPAPTNTLNPRAVLEYNTTKIAAYRGISKLYGEAGFLKYFTFSSSLGVDFMLAESLDKNDPRFRQGTSNVGFILDRDKRTSNVITSNLLSMRLPVKKIHNIGLLLGQEAQILTDKVLSGESRADTNALSIYDQLTSPGYTTSQLIGLKYKQTMLSLFGQLNYGFDKRYFLSASIRRDGSSRFGASELWGTYWSAGGGWVVTEETIFGRLQQYLSFFKIRGSLGAAGNSGAVSPTTKYDILRQGLYANNTSLVIGTEPGNIAIRWEKTFSWNAGLDARLLRDRVSITLDFYNKKTSDVIYPVNLPSVSGFNVVKDNIGDIQNKGVEISITGSIIERKDLKWSVSGTVSSNKNVLIRSNIPFSALTTGNIANEEGRNYNSFYMREWAGVNREDGKPMWLDSSGKGTSNYNLAKRSFVGKPQPDGFGSFSTTLNYKGFDLSILLYFQYGYQIMYEKLMTLENDGAMPFINQSGNAMDYWRKPGDISRNPRRILNNTDGGRNASTRYLFDGDYLKLSNVLLGYNFQGEILQRTGLTKLRVYIQGNNLALWTKLPNQDPDNANVLGGVANAYPNARNFSFGVQANF